MPQQINLCSPILLTQKRYFSAQTMLQALVVFVLLGGALMAYGVWSLNTASADLKNTLARQAHELEGLQAALKSDRSGGGGLAHAALAQELQTRKAELLQGEQLLQALRQGVFKPGWGHAARLQLIAQSIPPQVWVTQIKADAAQLEVSGFTLEPAALNQWVARLSDSALLKGQELSTVKLDNLVSPPSAGAAAPSAAGASAARSSAGRATWSFSLLSALAKPSAGVKP
jgi:Tfp pilus assembly protein PilN